MSQEFWTNPPWANGNGGYQMHLQPLADSLWCERKISNEELRAKQQLLTNHFATTVQTTAESAQAELLLAQAIAERHTLAEVEAAQLNIPDGVATKLVASALSVPEDLCLMQKDAQQAGADYRLVAACVCSPSYWYLPEKIGQSLTEIHQVVPGLIDAIGDRMNEFFERLPLMRVFTRRNWLLHTSSELYQPEPDLRSPLLSREDAEALAVRSETQTLRRLSPSVVIFTIAVECHPLTEIYSHPRAAATLAGALLSRSSDEKAAAGQASYERGVLELLDYAQTL